MSQPLYILQLSDMRIMAGPCAARERVIVCLYAFVPPLACVGRREKRIHDAIPQSYHRRKHLLECFSIPMNSAVGVHNFRQPFRQTFLDAVREPAVRIGRLAARMLAEGGAGRAYWVDCSKCTACFLGVGRQ
jgi:hypothetical protein